MLLDTLQIFCDVVENNSFSKGAELNGVTQSRASQSVHKMEEHFGVALINRSSRPWTVTEDGMYCRNECLKLLGTYKGLEKRLKSTLIEKEQSVSVGTIYSVGFSYMTKVETLFDQHFPEKELAMHYLHPDQVLDKVRSGEIDLGVLSFASDHEEFEVVPWKDEEMVAVVTTGHVMAAMESVSIDQLQGMDFVAFDNELVIAKEIQKILVDNGVKMGHTLHVDNVEAIKRAVEDSRYITILPKSTLKRELETGLLVAIPFSGVKISRPIAVIYKKGMKVNSAMKEFMKLLFNG